MIETKELALVHRCGGEVRDWDGSVEDCHVASAPRNDVFAGISKWRASCVFGNMYHLVA